MPSRRPHLQIGIASPAGFTPDRPLHAYRDATLCLTVRSIGEGAKYTVKSMGHGAPGFTVEGTRGRATGSPVRKSWPVLSHYPPSWQQGVAALRSRLVTAEFDSIGVALRGDFISTDDAVAWLNECGGLQFLTPTVQTNDDKRPESAA